MKAKAHTDHRATLQIAQETWDREDHDGKRRLVEIAAGQGYALRVIRPEGDIWTPDPQVEGW